MLLQARHNLDVREPGLHGCIPIVRGHRPLQLQRLESPELICCWFWPDSHFPSDRVWPDYLQCFSCNLWKRPVSCRRSCQKLP